MWNFQIASFVKNGQLKVACIYFLNALLAKAFGGLLALNGTLNWTCTA
jgi:hypothetical protein